MQTLTPEQFKKQYGEVGPSLFPTPQTSQNEPGLTDYGKRVVDTTSTDMANRAQRISDIQKNPDTSEVQKAVQTFGQGAGFAAKTLETTVGEIQGIKQAVGAVGSGINWLATSDLSPIKHLGDFFGSNKTLQTAVSLYDRDQNFKDSVDAVANIVRLGGDVTAAKDVTNFTKNVTSKITGTLKSTLSNGAATDAAIPTAEAGTQGGNTAFNVARDIIPTSEKIVNGQVGKALGLNTTDLRNIKLSTGNDAGDFVARENLIGENKPTTVKNIQDFFDRNYTAVRSEIGKVTTQYTAGEIPEYKQALTSIKSQIQDVAGLGDANTEVDALLKKKIVTLDDIQRAKELLDEHFSLYKNTGDVSQGVAKQGLANIRSGLKTFIEEQVKLKTGADIAGLNNNVQTSRSLLDAIETRAAGMTPKGINAGDIMTMLTGSGFGGPVGGIVAVIGKKIFQSPTFKLRLAKWLDGLNDAEKAKVAEDLSQNKVPKGLKAIQKSSK